MSGLITLLGSPGSHAIDDGLIGHWSATLDNLGSGQVVDRSISGINLVRRSGVTYRSDLTDRGGTYCLDNGSALPWDKKGLDSANANLRGPFGAFALFAYVRVTGTAEERSGYAFDNGTNRLLLGLNRTSSVAAYENGLGVYDGSKWIDNVGAPLIAKGEWVHLCWTRDPGDSTILILYENGAEKTRFTGFAHTGSIGNVTIGNNWDPSGNTSRLTPTWLVDTIRLYDRALSQSEVQLLSDSGRDEDFPVSQEPPVNTVLPAVTGSTVVGGTLTTTDGTWTNNPSYTYEWERSGDGSTGWESVPETNNTYVTDDPADIGYYFRSKVTATNVDGSASAYSTPVGPVSAVAENRRIFHFRFEEDPSVSSPLDETENGFNCARVGTFVSGDSVQAKYGNGLRFDGSSQYVRTPVTLGTGWEVPGGFANTGLCWDTSEQCFWIGDYDNNAVKKVSYSGTLLATVSLSAAPQGIAYDSSDDTLWWSDNSNSAIRHIQKDGTTIPGDDITGLGYAPNGIGYDSNEDSIWVVYNEAGANARRYLCSTGALAETRTLTGITNTVFDGVHYEADTDELFITVDDNTVVSDTLYVFNAATGALKYSYGIGSSPEDVTLVDGVVYICHDALFHDDTPNGNRVRPMLYSHDKFSYGIWVNPVTIPDTDAIMACGNPVTGIGFGIYLTTTTNARVFIRDGTNTVFSNHTVSESGFDIFVTVDRVAKKQEVYIDGILDTTDDISALTAKIVNQGFVSFAASPNGDSLRYANVILDEAQYWTGVLTASEIADATSPPGVGNPPVNTVLPAVTGSTVVGGTLATTDGTWTNSPDDYAYEWERSGNGSTGWESVPETNNTYVTDDPADIGYYFRSKVTATNASGSASAYSTPVGPITAAAPTFKPHWALNRSRILGSGIR